MLKKRIIKGIILIVICLIIYFGNSSNCHAEQNYIESYKASVTSAQQPYGALSLQYVSYFNYEGSDQEYMFFCNRLGTPPILINKAVGSQGSPDITKVNTADKQDTTNPQLAYAMSIGVLPMNMEGGSEESWADLQKIIWDCKTDDQGDGILASDTRTSPDMRALTPLEVQRFRKVYEQIFEPTIGAGIPLFKIEDKDSSLFVDQNDGTYIYGPFQLKVNNPDASEEAISYLVDEIMEQGSINYIEYENGEGYIENFKQLHKSIDDNFIKNGISDPSKNKLRYDVNGESEDHNSYTTIMVDRFGNPIDLPEINKKDEASNNFFIKFYPANGGSIINLGNGEEDGELFSLKVKYGSYVNYKEHVQICTLYTKGVWGNLLPDAAGDRIVDPGNIGFFDSNGSRKICWSRVPGSPNEGNYVFWYSYLKGLYAPKKVILYDHSQTDVNKMIISGSIFSRENNYAEGGGEDKYALNNYYTDLKAIGDSINLKSSRGANIEIPFGFAGESDVEINSGVAAMNYDYPLELSRSMTLDFFSGKVKRTASVKYTWNKYTREEKKDAQGNVIRDANGNIEYTDWKWADSGTEWGTKTKYANEILYPNVVSTLTADQISTGTTSASGESESGHSNKSGNSTTKYEWSSTTYSYSISKIYGGEANGETATKGFVYKSIDEGWYYDRNFCFYNPRLILHQAVYGKTYAFSYIAGEVDEGSISEGQYVVRIPRDFEHPPEFSEIGSQESAKGWGDAQENFNEIKGNLQSFVSFEGVGVGDIYKYGTLEANEHVALPHLKIAEAFGGNVWKDTPSVKDATERSMDGKFNTDTEEAYRGVKVDLYECDIKYKEPQRGDRITKDDVLPGHYLTSTFTDADGDYRFYGKIGYNTPLINPLKKYFVKFIYNGQIYAQTLYNVKLNEDEFGEYKDKTSKAIDEYRTEFNQKFENIYADYNNYTYAGQRYVGCNGTKEQNYAYTGRAYGLKHAIKEAIDNPNYPADRDTFEEQYNLFVYNNTHADFITTTAEYEFKHAGGGELTNPIDHDTGEIVESDIDKDWEYKDYIGQPIDFNYSDLAPSVAAYLRDCMIEASVPYQDYTHDLTVYGNNVGRTDLHMKFPLEATFNLKDMTRVYMDHYRRWTLKADYKLVPETDPRIVWETEIPSAIRKYVEGKTFPENTVITLFEVNGEEYYHIELGNGGASVDIKVASLGNDGAGFRESAIKVASYDTNFTLNEPEPENVGPGEPTTPQTPMRELWGLQWEEEVIDQVHTRDDYYIPPKEDYINLYNKEFDLRHCWSFGVYQRNFNEVVLEKDLYKATIVVNGKKEVYTYANKTPNQDGGPYNIVQEERLINLNRPLTGGNPYTREIRKSDYLYDENVAYGNGQYSKNIQAYLTYRLQITNKGSYTVRINEIADYYDADNLEFDGVRYAQGDAKGKLITTGNEGRYQIAPHTENIDGEIKTSKYTYASNLLDRAGHDPNKEYIGVYEKSLYANGGNNDESFAIDNHDPDNDGQQYHLETIYIRGVDAEGNSIGIPVVGLQDGNDVVTNQLIPDQAATLFVTFKVKNNSIDHGITTFANQIKLDNITRDFAKGLKTVGKNNFAEVNSYATYYTSEVPEDAPVEEKTYYRPYGEGRIRYEDGKATYLDINGNPVGVENDPNILIAGTVDVYSNPGSFTDKDVEVVYSQDGQYKDLQFKDYSYRQITRTSPRAIDYPRVNKNDPDVENLLPFEPDTDKAPTIRLILDDQQIRKISGIVFEDKRTVNSDGSPIGDGEKSGDDTPINGVTVQLVELIQDVDYDGTFTGQYLGEKVWDECEYTGYTDTLYQLKPESENQGAQYYSGKGTKYILNVNKQDLPMLYTDLSVVNEATEDGKYCFAGLPTGDFVVRFLYGDTERTVLTKTNLVDRDNPETTKLAKENTNENNGAISEVETVNRLVGTQGMNVKSYNGQDYKSTVYQRKLNSNSSTSYQVNQDEISYNMKDSNAVKGYIDTLNQDYASTWNYYNHDEENYLLRDKTQLYNSEVLYYKGQPINNNGDLKPSQNVGPRDNVANSYGSMWRYDRIATEDKPNLSDANDLYGYRQRGIDYAQGYATGVSEEEKTLMNYRAEVLSSFERVTSQEDETGAARADVQKAMLNEFIENTYMVAQSGIISMNHEYEGINDNDKNINNGNTDASTELHMVTGGITHENHARDVDLGLVERPRSQVKLTKEVANLEIKLADGQTLFNANTSMKDLMFTEHVGHEINYDKPNVGPILENVRVKLQTQSRPEIIQATMDDEIMDGATINVTYHLQVENVGEVDYLDRDFYYYGRKSGAVTGPVKTKVVRVIDYVPNDLSYDSSKQNADAKWEVYTPSDLIRSRITIDSNNNNKIDNTIPDAKNFVDEVAVTKNEFINRIEPRDGNVSSPEGKFYDKMNRDYVTRTYANEVATYNTIVVTKDLNDPLLPTVYVKGKDTLANQNIDKTTLILTTTITASGNSEDLTYNNLAEIIETSNPYGRRMQFSIAGNQEMANQDINDGGMGDNEEQDHHGFSASKITQPKEIDADSAQQVVILPPTGSPEYRNTVLTIITTAIATIIVLVGAVIIKKKVYEK